MARLLNFDYKSPYYYMVTLKRAEGLAAFSEIGPKGIVENEITRAFKAIIRGFHEKWRCCEEISPFAIMPDHLHLIIKIRDIPDRVALGVLVSQLSKALRGAYWRVVAADAATRKTLPGGGATLGGARGSAAGGAMGAGGARGSAGGASAPPSAPPPPPIFEPDWHDWIVKREGQLATFRRYIRENAERAWNRRQNARYFGRVTTVDFLGRQWFAYGNRAILDLPVIAPFKGHRATANGSAEWQALVTAASRIGPGGAGVSTFMSPLEKACGNAIYKAGGKLIMLSPEGFGPRWHPPREKERLCAQGRMLFLSLYEPSTRKATRQELYDRCHEMIDWVSSYRKTGRVPIV